MNDIPAIDPSLMKQRIELFEKTLSLNILLNEVSRYQAAVMTLCNELAARFQCSRVSLGWLEKKYIRIQGMSHVEHFEPKMSAVQDLEAAMEETLDQNEEIIFPANDTQWQAIIKSHERYINQSGSDYIVSLPLRINDEPVSVLSCERATSFDTEEVRTLRMICDQIIRRLFDLKQQDQWFGARFARWIRGKLATVFGVEHTFAKLISLICLTLLIYAILGEKMYRIKAPCILKTDQLAYVQAPFNGYISTVDAQIGDFVRQNDLLLELDTRDLRLKEAEIVADIHQFSRAEEKARSQDQLADMRIAQARLERSQLELKRILYLLDHAKVKAPFEGIVVQGERQKLLGAPVREGDVMYKIAQLKDYYIQLDVAEQDIHQIQTGDAGKIAFISRPERKFPIHITQISSTAQVKDKQNIFEVRAALNGQPEKWWRAGMSGIGHIDIGQRQIIWIYTHRTLDYIYLHFWWVY
ncbi:MAG: membrane-fusion protein-like protein [Candidatus Magnetoglobus multicellularis str. Araruama]|uniref:Membrane-fusion protein-like protein n=1 Tax=Candidatus Magnetoglobus multicellularis str. Araruama TaxID=890399 RepID=A0A1V1P4I1_9BACT|nr:MAG: membrane-fusion protein-like protein [Candidatus Magnetoglobus multicellularis str. Araruama]